MASVQRKRNGRSSKRGTGSRRYGRKASEKVEKAMHEMKRGELRSGRSGQRVTSRKQAIAIGLSQAARRAARFRGPPAPASAASVQEFHLECEGPHRPKAGEARTAPFEVPPGQASAGIAPWPDVSSRRDWHSTQTSAKGSALRRAGEIGWSQSMHRP